jgi:hypothetical protein
MENSAAAARISESNRINAEIKTLESGIETNTKTVRRLAVSTTNVEFNKEQVKKLRETIKSKKDDLAALKERLTKLRRGELDEQLAADAKVNKELVLEKLTKKMNNKAKIKEFNDKNKEISNEYYQKMSADERKFRFDNNIEKTTDYFFKLVDSVPDYIEEKLKRMPSNKGYIWRGLYCYGYLPEEKHQPVVLFEKMRNGANVTHEWNKDYYRKFEKNGNERQRLVFEGPRTSIKNNTSSFFSIIDTAVAKNI